MNFRLIVYWIVCIAVAVVASGYLVGHAQAADEMRGQLAVVGPPTQAAFQLAGVSELARAVLLFVGIIAVAYTYQQAWMNFRSAPSAQNK